MRRLICGLKVGGMGDVVTALGRAVQDEGHQVEVILPKYDCMDYDQVLLLPPPLPLKLSAAAPCPSPYSL